MSGDLKLIVACRPGKIAVDPTSGEDASVELNQSTQLGATGTSATNTYPTYADGTKVKLLQPGCQSLFPTLLRGGGVR